LRADAFIKTGEPDSKKHLQQILNQSKIKNTDTFYNCARKKFTLTILHLYNLYIGYVCMPSRIHNRGKLEKKIL